MCQALPGTEDGPVSKEIGMSLSSGLIHSGGGDANSKPRGQMGKCTCGEPRGGTWNAPPGRRPRPSGRQEGVSADVNWNSEEVRARRCAGGWRGEAFRWRSQPA